MANQDAMQKMYQAKIEENLHQMKENDESWRPLYRKEEWNMDNLQPKFSNYLPNYLSLTLQA